MDEKEIEKTEDKDKRISSAFPPSSKKGQKTLIAEVHKYFNQDNFVFDKTKIKFFFNNINIDLIKQLDDLNKEWFPVSYGKDYFKEIKSGKLNTFLAVYPIETKTGKRDFIIGGMVYKEETAESKYISYYDSFRCFMNSFKSAHIYTLGVINGLRGTGIGSMIMTNFLDFCENGKKFDNDVEAGGNICLIHLDVVAYNKSAIRYYLRNGFEKFKFKKAYYKIYDVMYDGIEMVCYMKDVKKSRVTSLF